MICDDAGVYGIWGNYMTRTDIIPLYLLRFVCAMLILLHHVGGYFGIELYRSKYTLDIAVDFFFILSGFMMYYIYPDIKDKSSYILQRVFRLYPVHLILIVFYILMFGRNCPLGAVVANIFCIQSFFLTSDYYFSLNSVSWCVCVELFFYICYAIGYKHIFKSLAFFMGINAVLYLIVYKYDIPYSVDLTKISGVGLLKFFPPARALQFFAGCCAAFFLKYKPQIKSVLLSNILCVSGIFLVLFSGWYIHLPLRTLQYGFVIQYYKTILICLGIFLCCFRCDFLPSKLSVLLGKISFCLFMIHVIIKKIFVKYNLFAAYDNISRFTIYLSVCLLMSFVLYYFIEQPIYGYLKGNVQKIKQFAKQVKSGFFEHLSSIINTIKGKLSMIKSIKKISKKHYIQCGLAVLLTGLVLYFTSALWSSKAVIVSFNAEAKKEITYQVFYQTTENKNYIEKYSISQKVKAGKNDVEIVLPTDSVKGIRLDFGSYPKTVKVKDIKVIGDTVAELKDFDKYQYYKIDSKKIGEDGSLTIVSNQNDPFMYTNRILDVRGKCIVDWCRFIIISVLAFLLMYKFVQYLSKFKIEKQHSRIDIVMLAVFFALLFVPMSHISDAEKSEQENRMLAKKPQLTIDGGGYNNYGVQFDAWYNDHFFGRDWMMGLYNYTKFSVNSVVESNSAMIGKKGYMYTKSFNSVDMYKNANLFSDVELKIIGENIERFAVDAKNEGVKNIYFMLSNDKESMYPEYYPSYIKKTGKISRLEQLLNYMHSNYPRIKFLNFRDKFESIKKSEDVFCKTGTHMNGIGAFYEYYFLTSEIKKDYPELNILKLNDLDIREDYSCDDDIYKSFGIKPYYFSVYSKENFKNKKLLLKNKNAKLLKTVNMGNIQHFYYIFENNKGLLNTLIIGDSFVVHYIDKLAESFNKTMYIYNGLSVGKFMYNNDEIKEIYRDIPDIVVVEVTERGLQRFLTLEFPKMSKN